VVRLVDTGWDEAPGGPPELGTLEPGKIQGVGTMPAALQRAPAPKAELIPDALDLGTAVLAAVAQEVPRAPVREPSPSPERKLSPSPERKLSPSPERKLSPSPERKLSPSPEAARKPPPKPAAEPFAATPRKDSPAPLPQRSALASLTRPKADSPKPTAALEISKHAVVRLEPPKPVEVAKPAASPLAALVGLTKPAADPVPPKADGPVLEVHSEEIASEELPPPLPDVEPAAEMPPAATAERAPEVAPTSLELARTLRMTNAQVQSELEKGRARDDSSPAVAPVITHVESPKADSVEHFEEAEPPAAVEDDDVERSERAPRHPPRSEGVWGAVRIVAITTAAAALSYGVVRFAVAPRIARHAAQDATAAASAVQPHPAVAKPAPKVVPVVQDLDLPADIPVGADKGLLEVELTERHALYVDGVFVGRGPMRRVPLEPGKHELEVRSAEGASEKHELDVRKGRRTRWQLPAAAK
jgi:hypothetical protein